MSREVKRVALDFQWPLDKRWSGYLMPDELRLPQCADCGGRGYSGGGLWLDALMYRLTMLARHVVNGEDALHPWLAEDPYPPTREITRPVTPEEQEGVRAEIERCEAEGRGARSYLYQLVKDGAEVPVGAEIVQPSADLVHLVAALSGQAPERIAQGGSSTSHLMAKAIVEAAGLDPDTWGSCPTCEGEGTVGTPEQYAAAEAWERTEPPAGPGWQFWESVSEGAPISPVFPDREGLVDWLSTEYSWGAHHGPMTRSAAEALVDAGDTLGVTFVVTGGGQFIHGEEMPAFAQDGVDE
jgi:hypothetical protein